MDQALSPTRRHTRRLRRVVRRLLGQTSPSRDKYSLEEDFWRRQIERIQAWYRGDMEAHFRTPAPLPEQRIAHPDERVAAILTWFELHQKPKYLKDLGLPPDAFQGMRILDVGAGPMPSAEGFKDCDVYCLDPLYAQYLEAGWPIHVYGPRTWFVRAHAEAMPFEDSWFDAVISVNAIDHVDDFEGTAREIARVLQPGGRLRLHVHYHSGTPTEPQRLDDERVSAAFAWCKGFRKVAESTRKSSADAAQGESFALWSSF